MNAIHQAVELINSTIETNIKLGDRARYLCIADLVEKNGRIFPVVKRNNDTTSAEPSKNYTLSIYHRITEGPDSEMVKGFGDDTYDTFTIKLKCVGFADPKVFGNLAYTTRDIAMRVMDSIPSVMDMSGSEIRWMKSTKIGNIEVDADVWKSEMPSADMGKVNPLAYAAFSFEYTITGQLCSGYCLSGGQVLLPSICEPVVVTDTDDTTHTIAAGGAYTCTRTVVSRVFTVPTGYDAPAYFTNAQEPGTVASLTYGTGISAVALYINDVLSAVGATFTTGDSIRLEITRSSNAASSVTLGIVPTASTVSSTTTEWQWTRWTNLNNFSSVDNRFTGAPYSLITTGLGGFSPNTYNKNVQSIQRITWADDFTVEFGDCALPQEIVVGLSDSDNVSEGLGNILHGFQIVDGGITLRVRESGAFTYSSYFASLNQTIGGDILTILEATSLFRIVKSGTTISYQVKPRGDSGSAVWVTMYSSSFVYASSKQFRVEVNIRYAYNFWNGVRLYGNWV